MICSTAGGVGFGEGFGSGEEAKELGRDLVYADVGGLRGEDRRDRQLKGVAVIERADDVGVGLAERVEDGGDALRCEGIFGFAGLRFGRDGLARRDLLRLRRVDTLDRSLARRD